MKTKSSNKFIKVFFTFMLLALPMAAKSQSSVTEISWQFFDTNHRALLVMYPNDKGVLRIQASMSGVGLVWVHQDAVLTRQYDVYGNCTVFINCFNPKTNPSYVSWSADSFVIYPNGAMYTQDASGNWSTFITAYTVAPYYWEAKFREYGLQ